MDCKSCAKRQTCTKLCDAAELYASQDYAPLRESILPDDTIVAPGRHYSEALQEIIEDRRKRDLELLEMLRQVDNIRHRAALALSIANLTQADISTLLHIDQAYISRILRRYR